MYLFDLMFICCQHTKKKRHSRVICCITSTNEFEVFWCLFALQNIILLLLASVWLEPFDFRWTKWKYIFADTIFFFQVCCTPHHWPSWPPAVASTEKKTRFSLFAKSWGVTLTQGGGSGDCINLDFSSDDWRLLIEIRAKCELYLWIAKTKKNYRANRSLPHPPSARRIWDPWKYHTKDFLLRSRYCGNKMRRAWENVLATLWALGWDQCILKC